MFEKPNLIQVGKVIQIHSSGIKKNLDTLLQSNLQHISMKHLARLLVEFVMSMAQQSATCPLNSEILQLIVLPPSLAFFSALSSSLSLYTIYCS